MYFRTMKNHIQHSDIDCLERSFYVFLKQLSCIQAKEVWLPIHGQK